VSQVQAKVNQLTSQFDKVSEQLDQAGQQLSAAQSKLSQVQVHLKNANAEFQAAQANVAQNAAAAFEDTGSTSVAGVLTSGNPSVILQQGSLLLELSGSRTSRPSNCSPRPASSPAWSRRCSGPRVGSRRSRPSS